MQSFLCCPACQGDLQIDAAALQCLSCGRSFPTHGEIPQLFWGNEWPGSKPDVTEIVRSFYEGAPFPDYDDCESVGSLIEKAERSRFAALLDEQIPVEARVLDCGCGTGQMSNFLSFKGRAVVGGDLSLSSLRLGHEFKKRFGLSRVQFVQMNLFRPPFRAGTFDVVLCNGALHHTSDPALGFEVLARTAKKGGYVVVGLYHRYGRLMTDLKRLFYKVRAPHRFLEGTAGPKERAWFLDQFRHPHESKHTFREVLGWMERAGCEYVRSVPRFNLFDPLRDGVRLFEPELPPHGLAAFFAELGMAAGGGAEGGFFVMIARRR